jgi:two-component system, LytTR family, response regulator
MRKTMIGTFTEKNVFEQLGKRCLRGIVPEEVVRILADVNYSELHLTSGRKHLTSKTLKSYEEILQRPFVRVNKSCIVNLQHVTHTDHLLSQIELSDGSVIQVSRRRRHLLSK